MELLLAIWHICIFVTGSSLLKDTVGNWNFLFLYLPAFYVFVLLWISVNYISVWRDGSAWQTSLPICCYFVQLETWWLCNAGVGWLQGKTSNIHDQLKFTKLFDESSTNTSPAWKDDFLVSLGFIMHCCDVLMSMTKSQDLETLTSCCLVTLWP